MLHHTPPDVSRGDADWAWSIAGLHPSSRHLSQASASRYVTSIAAVHMARYPFCGVGGGGAAGSGAAEIIVSVSGSVTMGVFYSTPASCVAVYPCCRSPSVCRRRATAGFSLQRSSPDLNKLVWIADANMLGVPSRVVDGKERDSSRCREPSVLHSRNCVRFVRPEGTL